MENTEHFRTLKVNIPENEFIKDFREYLNSQSSTYEAYEKWNDGTDLLDLAYFIGVDKSAIIKVWIAGLNKVKHLMKDQGSLNVIDALTDYIQSRVPRYDLNSILSDACNAVKGRRKTNNDKAASGAFTAIYEVCENEFTCVGHTLFHIIWAIRIGRQDEALKDCADMVRDTIGEEFKMALMRNQGRLC